ncbi:MAG TPA: PAS domain S-box protein [Gaiellaceae bacterium]|nr:PAS domain S-box protein [Gaiellaceae bacterium]
MERLRHRLPNGLLAQHASSRDEREGTPREDPRLLARFACYLYGGGAAIILLTLPFPSHPEQHDVGLALLGVLAAFASLVFGLGFGAFGPRIFQAAAALGTLVITAAIYLRVDEHGPYVLFYVWPILFSFFFFRRRAAFVQLGLIAAAYGILAAVGRAGQYEALYWAMLVTSLGIAGVLVSFVTDRLERVWARERESERRFRTLVSNIPGAVYRCAHDADWTMEFLSDAIESISGYPASDFIANRVRSFASIIHPEDAGSAAVEAAVASGKPYTLEYRIVHRDGGIRWVHERGQASVAPEGDVRLDGAIFDVTERKRFEEDLREAEAKYRTLVEHLPLVTYIDAIDAASSNIYSSPQTEALLGYSPEEWQTDRELFAKVVHPGDRERVLREHARCHETGESLRTEYRLITRDGRVVWVQDEAVVLRDDGGRPLYLQGFLLDVTARKESETVRNRLASIVESSVDAIFSTSTEGVIESWNRGAERMYGYAPEEIVGESVARLTPPDRLGEVRRILDRVVGRAESVRFETVRIRRDGSPIDVALTVSPILDSEGRVVGASGIQRDITERRRAELALREKTAEVELLQSVAEAANEATTFESAMQFALDRICAYMGWPVGHVYLAEGEILVPTELWHMDDAERFREFRAVTARTVFAAGVGLPGRVLESGHGKWVADVSGDEAFARRRHANRAGLRGAFAFPVLVGREVAAVLEFFSLEPAALDDSLADAMANVGAQLGRVVERTRAQRALAEQNERLRELDRMKDDFVALVSHELRTPLTSIRGYVELLGSGRTGALGGQQRRYLDVVERNSRRLLRLVDDLLFFSQARARGLELALEPIDARDVARDAVDAARPAAEKKQIDLELELDGPAPVEADRARLGQLLDNLLSNAIKFTPEGGRVEVSALREDGEAIVTISDSGLGIPSEDQERVFDGFFRSASATEQAIPGTGLGLAIAQTIAAAHGGSIAVASLAGEGTTFTVRLPARDEPAYGRR